MIIKYKYDAIQDLIRVFNIPTTSQVATYGSKMMKMLIFVLVILSYTATLMIHIKFIIIMDVMIRYSFHMENPVGMKVLRDTKIQTFNLNIYPHRMFSLTWILLQLNSFKKKMKISKYIFTINHVYVLVVLYFIDEY